MKKRIVNSICYHMTFYSYFYKLLFFVVPHIFSSVLDANHSWKHFILISQFQFLCCTVIQIFYFLYLPRYRHFSFLPILVRWHHPSPDEEAYKKNIILYKVFRFLHICLYWQIAVF